MTEVEGNSGFDLQLIRDFFDAATCEKIISEMRRSAASPAVTYGQSNEGTINEGVRRVSRVKPSLSTVKHVSQRLIDCREKLETYFKVALQDCEEPQFLHYRVGDFFVAHQDGNTGLLRLDSDQSRRVSVSIFLNRETEVPDTGAYGGGSLVFHDWRNRKQYRLIAEAGTLVAFRSETTHEVVPVTFGDRYSIVTWYRSRDELPAR